jgi:hypothetical protein
MLLLALEKVSGQLHAPTALSPAKEPPSTHKTWGLIWQFPSISIFKSLPSKFSEGQLEVLSCVINTGTTEYGITGLRKTMNSC